MPDGDGFTLLQQLKSTPRYRVVPTIVMSASSDADDIRKSYMLGASSYFVKPAGFEALARLLKLLYEVWLLAELPVVDAMGRQLDTNSAGKLGERFPQDLETTDGNEQSGSGGSGGSLYRTPGQPHRAGRLDRRS
jgi:DNA-binding NarL/FixJ family response regulator